MKYKEVFNEITKDHNKVFVSGSHEMKYLVDGIYIITSVGMPFSIKTCEIGAYMEWIERKGEVK